MQKLTAKKLIEFRRLTTKRRQIFVNSLLVPSTKSGPGGDYWISCISAIAAASKKNNTKLINDKIEFLQEEIKAKSFNRTKIMYQRNIDILSNFIGYDFSKLKPKRASEFTTKPNSKLLLNLKGLLVQVYPSHVFTYKNLQNEVGATWFVAQLNGFDSDELQIYAELLYKYLYYNYSKKYSINTNLCVVVDVVTQKDYKYSKILSLGKASQLDIALLEIKNMLKK